MTQKDLLEIIDYLILECTKLKNKYVNEKNLEIDYICVFSQNINEYNDLLKTTKTLGKIVNETPTGPIFAFNTLLKTIAGSPKLLKIRKLDETRPQRGDVDFNTDYENFKKKYIDNEKFSLIKRENFEMIELRDNSFNVLVYFSSIPLSRQLKIT
jgi:hypothetical protein